MDILQLGRNDVGGYFYYVMELADDATQVISKTVISKSVEGGGRAITGSLNTESLITDYSPQTLRSEQRRLGRIPVNDCLDIALALTDALAHLHVHGLVHRDIKPSNIIFVNGKPKLADVGLVADISEARSFVGTMGFIPPEGPGKAQADLYSLGKVLYEISTGKDRQEFPALPPSLRELPDHDALIEFNEIVLKACDDDARQRYATAQALHDDLALLQQGQSVIRKHTRAHRLKIASQIGLATAAMVVLVGSGWLLSRVPNPSSDSIVQRFNPSTAPADLKSIAVLPFDNDSPDGADEYWATQFADELSSALTRIPDLRVLGRSSALALKRAADLPATARALHVGAALGGRVRKSGNKIQVSAQLTDTRSGYLFWSEVHECDLPEVFGLQSMLAEKVVSALGLRLTGTLQDRLSVKPTSNLAAYQAYLDGLREGSKFTLESTRTALKHFQAAIDLDPKFVAAYASLADAHLSLSVFAGAPEAACYSNANAMVQAGLALDSQHRALHAVLARMKTDYEWKWDEAEREYKLAGSHGLYARLLAALGRHDEAIAEGMKSLENDPLAADARRNLGSLYYFARRYGEAETQLQEAIKLDPNYAQNYWELALVYERTARFEQAVQAWAKWKALRGKPAENVQQSLDAYAAGGRDGYLRSELTRALEYRKQGQVRAFPIARIYAMLGEKEPALDWLEAAYADRDNDLPWVNGSGMFDFLRDEPRFIALLRKVGLEK